MKTDKTTGAIDIYDARVADLIEIAERATQNGSTPLGMTDVAIVLMEADRWMNSEERENLMLAPSIKKYMKRRAKR